MLPDRLVEGVCAFIVRPEDRTGQFLAGRETESKRGTGKLAGGLTPIIETVRPGESHAAALRRAVSEELTNGEVEEVFYNGVGLDRTRLCEVQLSPGAWLHAYLIPLIDPKFMYHLGLRAEAKDIYGETDCNLTVNLQNMYAGLQVAGQEFRVAGWRSIQDVLRLRSDPRMRFVYRPGVLEVAEAYMRYLSNPNDFQVSSHHEPLHPVPSEVFDYLDREELELKNMRAGGTQFDLKLPGLVKGATAEYQAVDALEAAGVAAPIFITGVRSRYDGKRFV